MKLRKNFARNLKAMRVHRGHSQERLAELLDINVRYVQLLESKAPPNVKLDTIETIARVLKSRPRDFFN